jgi:cobalt-zinc-cadmium efflux system outer membrane protein
MLLSPSPLPGQASDTLRLADAVAEARRANPMLQSARYRADAASERVPQAGALPDPRFAFGLVNRPIDGFGTDVMMTMNAFELSQRFPWPGKLGFSQTESEHLARADQLDAEEMETALIARVKSAYYQLAFVDRAVEIMSATRELLRDFEQVTTARYAVGAGIQQDILQAQVAVASVRADIRVLRERRVAMAARLNSLLGRPATRAIGALELPDIDGPLPSVDALLASAVSNRPALQAAAERVAAAEAGYRAARRQLYPDFDVRVAYGQRPQYEDLVTIAVGINIPLWAGSKQLPLRREMLALESASGARQLDLYNETYARLTELRAAAERAKELERLYRTSILPQSAAAVESALSAYRVGQVDYMTLLTNQMTLNQFEIETVRLTAQYHEATAGIEALTNLTIDTEDDDA